MLADLFGFKVRRLHGLFVKRWLAHFGALGLELTPVQGGVIILIAHHAGISQKGLADLLGMEPASMHEALRPLLDAGLVARARSQQDRRSYDLSLTPKGVSTFSIIKVEVGAHERAVLSSFEEAEVRTFSALLAKALDGTPG